MIADYARLGLLFLVGAAAGFINVNAGGGSTLTLPVLIFMGLDSALANGTNRVAILAQNLFGVMAFRRQQVHQFRASLRLALITLPGGIAGALISVRITHEWFQRILALVMFGIVISMFVPRARPLPAGSASLSPLRRWLAWLALFGVGFYGGFIQVGVGFLLMATLYHLLHVNLLIVNMHKVFIIVIYTIPAVIIFILTGNVNWGLSLVLSAGNALGAWWGAHASVRGGEKTIRAVLATAIVIMAVKLLVRF